jgi:hypothetical protein
MVVFAHFPSEGDAMAEPKQRIVVDGIEFSQIVLFPRILKAVPAALQPARLLIALFIVLLLVTIGRVWDGIAPARFHPQGLTAGVWTDRDAELAQPVLRDALQRYAPQRLPQEGPTPTFTAREVLGGMQAGYRAQRRDLPRAERPEADEAYLGTVERVDALRPRGTFEAAAQHGVAAFYRVVQGVVFLQPAQAIAGFTDGLIVKPVALWRHDKLFTIVFGLLAVIVMAVGGGAISRLAAVEAAAQERLSVREALEFALVRWPRFAGAPLLPLLIAAAVGVVILVLGLLMAVPVLDVIGGVLYGLAIVLGFIVAFLLVVYIAAVGMIVPAVAAENCDAADAQQRAYAYVLTRPLHLLGYAVVAIIGLALGYVVVALFAVATLNMTAAAFGAFTTNPALTIAGGFGVFDLAPRFAGAVPGAWHHVLAAWLVNIWQTLVIALVWAFVVAYLFSAVTHIYILMRRACDGQAVDEVWQPGMVPGTLTPVAEAPAPEDEGSQT